MKGINIGCGNDIRQSNQDYTWVNFDIRPLPGVDIVGDARSLPFEDGSFDFALAQDVIEHIPYLDVDTTLREWHRVLRSGGLLEIRTPDFIKLARSVVSRKLSEEQFFFLVFGDQSPEAGGYEAGGHKSGKSKTQWVAALEQMGFRSPQVIEDKHEFNFHIRAEKK